MTYGVQNLTPKIAVYIKNQNLKILCLIFIFILSMEKRIDIVAAELTVGFCLDWTDVASQETST